MKGPFPTSFLRRILGWEYCVIRDLDLFNIPFECPNSAGVGRINDLAIKGWHPHLVLSVEAMGYKCAILFRRRVWFRRRYQRFFDAPSDKDFEINV